MDDRRVYNRLSDYCDQTRACMHLRTCFGLRVESTGKRKEELNFRSGLSHNFGPFCNNKLLNLI